MARSNALISSVMACCVCLGGCANQLIKPEEPLVNVKDYWSYVNISLLNIRNGPSNRHEIIGTVQSGVALRVTHHHNNWACVNLPGTRGTGYISRRYLDTHDTSEMNAAGSEAFQGMELNDYDEQPGVYGSSWWLPSLSIIAKMSPAETATLSLMSGLWALFNGSRLIDIFQSGDHESEE